MDSELAKGLCCYCFCMWERAGDESSWAGVFVNLKLPLNISRSATDKYTCADMYAIWHVAIMLTKKLRFVLLSSAQKFIYYTIPYYYYYTIPYYSQNYVKLFAHH